MKVAWGIVAIAFAIGFLLCFILPNSASYMDIDIHRKGAKVLVLSCIDPRFTERLAHFLINDKDVHADYDLVNLAGASLGVLQNDYPSWKPMFYDHLNIAVNLHNIKEVWVFDHLDCGMYKTTFGIESDLDKSIHVNYITELRKNLAESHPQLGFRGFVMMTDGHIEKIT
jgi:hypothetical protein